MLDMPLSRHAPDAAGSAVLGRIIEGASDGILVTACAIGKTPGVIQLVNHSFLDGTGYCAADVIGRPCTLFDPPPHQREQAVALSEALRTADNTPRRVTLVGRGGASRMVEVRCVAMPADNGKGLHRVAFARTVDRTQRIRQEKETVEHILASVFAVVDSGLALLDETGRFVMANRACADLAGISVEQMTGRSLTDFLPPEDRAGAMERHTLALATRRGDQRRVRIQRADGQTATAEVATLVVGGGEDRRIRVIALRKVENPVAALPMDFEQALRQRLAAATDNNQVVLSGRLRLIGLDRVRERFGVRWQATADQAMEMSAAIIRRRLAPEDVFAPTGDQGFVICFASLSEQEAEFKARSLRQEIHERLLGQLEDPEGARVSAEVAPVRLPDTEPDSPVSLTEMICGQLEADRTSLEQAARAALTDAFAGQRLDADPVTTASGDMAFALARLPEVLMAVIDRAHMALGDDETFGRDLDLLLLGLVAKRLAAGDHGPIYVVPVAYQTFASRTSTESYARICRAMALPARQKVLFELRRVPAAAAQSHLADILGLLGQFSRGVAVELPVADDGWVDWTRLQPKMLSLGFDMLAGMVEKGTERLQRLSRGAHLHQARIMVRGVPTAAVVQDLREAGVDFTCLQTPRT